MTKVRPTTDEHAAFEQRVNALRKDAFQVWMTLKGRSPDRIAHVSVELRVALFCLWDRLDCADHPDELRTKPLVPDEDGDQPRHRILSAAQHKALGKALFAMRTAAMELHIDLLKHYPKQAKVIRPVARACELIDRLRARLDGLLDQQRPEAFDVHIYYPGTVGFPA